MRDSKDRKKTIVLWDVGAVLHTIRYDHFFKKATKEYNQFHPGREITPERFRDLFIESGAEKRLDLGLIYPYVFLRQLYRIVSGKEMSETEGLMEMHTLRMSTYGKPVAETIQLKRAVHEAGYAVGILSNMSQEAKKVFRNNNREVFKTYDAGSPRILSSEVHIMKPDQSIYELVRGFNRVIFIYDKWEYLKVGIECHGWHGIWFTKYIDKSEANRASLSDDAAEMPEERFRRANTIDQLVRSLNNFGVNVAKQ